MFILNKIVVFFLLQPITLKMSSENYSHHNSPMSPQQILNQQQQHQPHQQLHHPAKQLSDPGSMPAVPRF